MGRGRGMGLGFGWRRGADMSAAVVDDQTPELEALRQQVEALASAIEELRAQQQAKA